MRRLKENIIKAVLSGIIGAFGAYFGVMLIPLAVLFAAMAADYVSGVVAAWFSGTLNSRVGKRGAVKKVCYMFLVAAAGIIDWVIWRGMSQIGIEYSIKYYFGMLVTIWLILNELLSILENCTVIGLPVPSFLKPLAKRLKILVEESRSDEQE